jgi:serine/threonine protein kinase
LQAVTGDDAAMSTLGVGADLQEFQKLFAPRVAELASDFIEPLDDLSDAVTRAEQELRALQSRQLDEMTERWNRYKSEYERYLRPEAVMEDESTAGEEMEQEEAAAADDISVAVETSGSEPTVPSTAAGNEASQRPKAQPKASAQLTSPRWNARRKGRHEGRRCNQRLQDLEDFKVVGAGLSKWTFAERGGRQYFIKEFLSPTYPDDDAPGSEKIKAKKRARCAAFEAHHRGVQRALAPLSAYGGNLIVTLDFFRWGAKYYKVTEKVDAEGLSSADIAALGLRAQLVLMKTVAHSLKILHDLKIVHGDLKPSNVLIKRTELGYTTKLIDFDNAYIAGSPPPPEEIVGTINYYSPELLGYIQEAGFLRANLELPPTSSPLA